MHRVNCKNAVDEIVVFPWNHVLQIWLSHTHLITLKITIGRIEIQKGFWVNN